MTTREELMNDPRLNTYERAHALETIPKPPPPPPEPDSDQRAALADFAARIESVRVELETFENRAEKFSAAFPTLTEEVRQLEAALQPESPDVELANLSLLKARLAVIRNFVGASGERRRKLQAVSFDLLIRLDRLLNKIFGTAARGFSRGHRLPLRLSMATAHIEHVLDGRGEPAENA